MMHFCLYTSSPKSGSYLQDGLVIYFLNMSTLVVSGNEFSKTRYENTSATVHKTLLRDMGIKKCGATKGVVG